MVVLDGVRYRKEDLERLHPDRVDEAEAEEVVLSEDLVRVTTAPGAVVVGQDEQGSPVVDTTDSSAGNVVVVDAAPGKSDGSGDEDATAVDKPKSRAGAKKQ